MGGLSAHIREERIHLEREEESALTTGKITNMKGIARRWLINSVGDGSWNVLVDNATRNDVEAAMVRQELREHLREQKREEDVK